MIKSLKNVGGNLTHFYLGPKTENSCWDPCFSVRSKIPLFCSTVLWAVLILVPYQNCTQKSLCQDFASLRNHSLRQNLLKCFLYFNSLSLNSLYFNFLNLKYDHVLQFLSYFCICLVLISFVKSVPILSSVVQLNSFLPA